MGKLLGWVIFIAILLWGVVFGLSIYLSPDNLANCDETPSSVQDCDKADVIVAISGGNTTARANSAIELYKNGWAEHIIFSGASADPNSPSNAAEMRQTALEAGVPYSAITLDETSRTTVENAQNVSQILANNGWEDIILTTSSYHLRRSKILFESNSGDRIRTAAAEDSVWDDFWWVTPHGWYLAFNELGGIVVFYIKGVL